MKLPSTRQSTACSSLTCKKGARPVYIECDTPDCCSYNPGLADTGEALGLDMGAIQQMSSQDASQAGITVRFYAGRITRGDLQGARVVMKAYPQVGMSHLCAHWPILGTTVPRKLVPLPA